MHKVFTIFVAVMITSCLAQAATQRFRNKRIPYDDDDYQGDGRDGDGNVNDDDRGNDLRDMRQQNNGGGRAQQFDMNRGANGQYDSGRGQSQLDYGRGNSQYDAYDQQSNGGGRAYPLDAGNVAAYNIRPHPYAYPYNIRANGYRPIPIPIRDLSGADTRGLGFGGGFPFNLFGLGGLRGLGGGLGGNLGGGLGNVGFGHGGGGLGALGGLGGWGLGGHRNYGLLF